MKLLPTLTLLEFIKCYLICIFLIFFNATISKAQETPLVLSNKCAKGISSFTKVSGIDFRFPDKDLGFVLAGWLNTPSKIECKGNFINSFCDFF